MGPTKKLKQFILSSSHWNKNCCVLLKSYVALYDLQNPLSNPCIGNALTVIKNIFNPYIYILIYIFFPFIISYILY